jgi:hypothetical protein
MAAVKVLFDVDTRSSSMRELARMLLAASPRASDPHAPVPLINENLHRDLTELVGADGLASLLQRALALASAEVPALYGAEMSKDGHLQGVEPLLTQAATARDQAAMAVTTQLLELLVTFIGETLTRRLVREACPGTSPEK